MRRISALLAATLLALALTASSALAMQPPGGGAQDNFGCPDPVSGHPGAAGLVDATPKVGRLTGNPTPTAWNAVANDNRVEAGTC